VRPSLADDEGAAVAAVNSPRRVADRPSAAAFIARGRRCAGKMMMRGRRDDEDDDRSLSLTSGGYTACGKSREDSSPFRVQFFRPGSPSAPRKAGDGLGSPDGWRPKSGRNIINTSVGHAVVTPQWAGQLWVLYSFLFPNIINTT
jgi:hypothetical protein